eukprot:scaffold99520_cov63-Phaeocystis_antarctica.AAC.1
MRRGRASGALLAALRRARVADAGADFGGLVLAAHRGARRDVARVGQSDEVRDGRAEADDEEDGPHVYGRRQLLLECDLRHVPADARAVLRHEGRVLRVVAVAAGRPARALLRGLLGGRACDLGVASTGARPLAVLLHVLEVLALLAEALPRPLLTRRWLLRAIRSSLGFAARRRCRRCRRRLLLALAVTDHVHTLCGFALVLAVRIHVRLVLIHLAIAGRHPLFARRSLTALALVRLTLLIFHACTRAGGLHVGLIGLLLAEARAGPLCTALVLVRAHGAGCRGDTHTTASESWAPG